MNKEDCILFSGGARGAEAEFGANESEEVERNPVDGTFQRTVHT